LDLEKLKKKIWKVTFFSLFDLRKVKKKKLSKKIQEKLMCAQKKKKAYVVMKEDFFFQIWKKNEGKICSE